MRLIPSWSSLRIKSRVFGLVVLTLLTLTPSYELAKEPTPDPEPPKVVEMPAPEVKKPEPPPRQYFKVELTGYCNEPQCNGSYADVGITASGGHTSQGTIAAPKNIPFGTEIIINGQTYRTEDRGSAIVVREDGTYIFDVWFPSHQEDVKFGRIKTTMYFENGKYYINY